jgi:hypothetical protein
MTEQGLPVKRSPNIEETGRSLMRQERRTAKLFVDENVPGRWRSASSQAF